MFSKKYVKIVSLMLKNIKVYDPREYKRLRNLRITSYNQLHTFALFHVWFKWINILFGASY